MVRDHKLTGSLKAQQVKGFNEERRLEWEKRKNEARVQKEAAEIERKIRAENAMHGY